MGHVTLTMPGRADRSLTRALRSRAPADRPPGPGGLLGLELEFSVRAAADGGRVDFGSLIHHLPLDGLALDPGDPNAYRCSWGGVITADGAEAELATPPVRTRPGFTGRLAAWAQVGEAALRQALPPRLELDGYSAHLSAAMPATLNDRVCQLYAETFAADLMLLMNRTGSPGLLVRPRPGRIELCGEFVGPGPLAAVTAFVAGSVRACAAAVSRPHARIALPPRLDVRLARAVHRYGWYVDRQAFGPDLPAAARRAVLARAAGGTIRAQSHLELAWTCARQALAADADAADLRMAEAMVAGAVPLPAEQGRQDRPPVLSGSGTRPAAPSLRPHVRPGFTVRPVAATWDFTMFEASGRTRTAYACIPRDSLPGFLGALAAGELDAAIGAYLARASRHRVLSAREQTSRPRLYDQVGNPTGLLAPERDPQTGRYESGRYASGTVAGKFVLSRPGKQSQQSQQSQPGHAPETAQPGPPRPAPETSRPTSPGLEPERRARPPRPHRAGVIIAIALAAVALLAGTATAITLLGPGSGTDTGPIAFAPTALDFPALPVGTSTASSVTVSNTAKSAATITSIAISGPGSHDFSVTAPALLTAATRPGRPLRSGSPPQDCQRLIGPAQACTIVVRFTPSAVGSRVSDLTIKISSAPQPEVIALSGTGAALPPPSTGAPAVTGISPASGPAGGGTTVVLTGSGFTGATGVSFGGAAAASFSVGSDTQIIAISPSGTGAVPITVATPSGTSPATGADQFTYTPGSPSSSTPATVPAVTGIAPADGPVGGGTTVVITGDAFIGATGVSFGTAAATSFSVDSDTQVTASSPAGSGAVDVTVTTPGGTSPATGKDKFTYRAAPDVADVAPADGPVGGGTTVVITGDAFIGATGVSFGTAAATSFSVDSDTQITAISPPGSAGPVDIVISTPGGISAVTESDQYSYLAAPAVTGVSPAGGPADGDTIVVITGSGFTDAISVSFDSGAASFRVDSDTQITAISPPVAATDPPASGAVDITVSTPGGISAISGQDQFTYVTVTGVSPPGGSVDGGTTVTITGSGFTPDASVSFGGTAGTDVHVVSDTQITVTSPSHDAGLVAIRVTTPVGTSGLTEADQYDYFTDRLA